MKKISLIFLIIFYSASFSQQRFIIDLNDRQNDLFNVTVFPDNLAASNNIYHFASTAPGTYQIMDIGRFVKSFKAFDENGNEINTENISTNKWKMEQPDKVKRIEYKIAEVWDTPIEENKIYKMAGSSIEDDHVLINGQTVFGYFEGMQKHPIEVKFEYPSEWLLGTALRNGGDEYYDAASFDHIVDSPILLGELTKASTMVNGTDINIYTYSANDVVKSEEILDMVIDILKAASEFTEGLPVDHYTFLFHFEDLSAGAWEHSYSSIYVYKEAPLNEEYSEQIRATVAHEFFHIVTPLNIHSELVANFNYENPTMSRHLWLYEGVTEWASDIMQLRGGLINLDEFLNEQRTKLIYSDYFDPDISLTELGSRVTELQDQMYSVYTRGAVTASLLDLRLLELSDGKRGLREIINELSEKYGPEKSISEENFFDELVEMTHPEIKNFIDNYIQGSKPLPVEEYYEKIGINYFEEKGADENRVSLGITFGLIGKNLVVAQNNNLTCDAKPGDILFKVNGEEVSADNARKIMAGIRGMKAGDNVDLILLRDEKEIEMTCSIEPEKVKHVFEKKPDPTEEQLMLREAWMKNL